MDGNLCDVMKQYGDRINGICGTYLVIRGNRNRARVIEATLQQQQQSVRETQESVMEL